MNEPTAIARAVELAGGITKMARAVGTTKGAVWAWVNRGRCPPEWAMAVAVATDGLMTVHDLRPDIFGATPKQKRSGMKAAA